MVYILAEASDDGTAKVVYTSIDRKFRKTFNALDWLARLVAHIEIGAGGMNLDFEHSPPESSQHT